MMSLAAIVCVSCSTLHTLGAGTGVSKQKEQSISHLYAAQPGSALKMVLDVGYFAWASTVLPPAQRSSGTDERRFGCGLLYHCLIRRSRTQLLQAGPTPPR